MAFRWSWLVARNPASPEVIAETHSFALDPMIGSRVDTYNAPDGVLGADTAAFFRKMADFFAVLALKSAI